MNTLALWAIAIMLAYTIWKGHWFMADLSRLIAAVTSVSAGIVSVAEAIRNPQVDNNDQATIDDLAGRLESAAESLNALAQEESDLDQGNVDPNPTPEPVDPEPASEEEDDSVEETEGEDGVDAVDESRLND